MSAIQSSLFFTRADLAATVENAQKAFGFLANIQPVADSAIPPQLAKYLRLFQAMVNSCSSNCLQELGELSDSQVKVTFRPSSKFNFDRFKQELGKQTSTSGVLKEFWLGFYGLLRQYVAGRGGDVPAHAGVACVNASGTVERVLTVGYDTKDKQCRLQIMPDGDPMKSRDITAAKVEDAKNCTIKTDIDPVIFELMQFVSFCKSQQAMQNNTAKPYASGFAHLWASALGLPDQLLNPVEARNNCQTEASHQLMRMVALQNYLVQHREELRQHLPSEMHAWLDQVKPVDPNAINWRSTDPSKVSGPDPIDTGWHMGDSAMGAKLSMRERASSHGYAFTGGVLGTIGIPAVAGYKWPVPTAFAAVGAVAGVGGLAYLLAFLNGSNDGNGVLRRTDSALIPR